MARPHAPGPKASAPKPRPRTAQRPKAPRTATSDRKRARRLDPGVRRALILDAAGRLVLEQGVSTCTLDDVAAASGVSKPLVYKYFASRDALLGALLQREFDYIRGRYISLLPAEATAEEAHRFHIRRYLEYLRDRGGLMRALISDPGVTSQVQETASIQQKAITQYWVDKSMEAYGLPKELARLGMIMTIQALEGAEGSLRLGKVDLDRAADFWTTFVLAGWSATSAKFGTRKR